MVFQIVASFDPGYHDLKKLESTLYKEADFSGPVLLEEKIVKWLNLFLHFCNYLPFEQDLAL
jgi:hypothetical protein